MPKDCPAIIYANSFRQQDLDLISSFYFHLANANVSLAYGEEPLIIVHLI